MNIFESTEFKKPVILIRRDTLSNWFDINPKLYKNELICVLYNTSDKVLGYKLGDGRHHFKTTPWINDLSDIPYFILYRQDKALGAVVLDGVISKDYLKHHKDNTDKFTKLGDTNDNLRSN